MRGRTACFCITFAITKPLFGGKGHTHSVIDSIYGIGLKSSNIQWYQTRKYNFGILGIFMGVHMYSLFDFPASSNTVAIAGGGCTLDYFAHMQ